MRAKTKLALEEAGATAFLFTAAIYLYYLTAAWGISDYLADGIFKDYVQGPGVHLEALITGLGFGLLLFVVNHIAESNRLRRLPFGYIILLKTGLYLVSLALVGILVNIVLLLFVISGEEAAALRETVTPRFAISAGVWIIFSILVINSILVVRRKVGPGNLVALLTGRYQHPHLENRLFLFLDLNGSTAIAERLGPKEYSRFVRQCFHDLTDIVLHYGAQIYQYVGDEVVLSWLAGNPEATTRCIHSFFAFEKKLREKKDWYDRQFGVYPLFRGGVEAGPVTATEVGDIKREIAFHGDTLNTAARLLDLCKEFGQDLLVSGSVEKAVSKSPGFVTQWQGEIALRGKRNKIPVYSINQDLQFDADNCS